MLQDDPASSAGNRRNAILKLLLERERILVRDLVEQFDVSAMTIHRDLDALEARGVLRKVRGGATVQPSASYESSLAFRLGEQRRAKEAIARHAARRVAPGSSVVLDDSTTALAMIPYLARIEQLTLVTNFVSIVDELSPVTDSTVTLIVIGGTYNPKYHAFGGALAESALADLRVDLCFLSVAAVDLPRGGAFHQEVGQAGIKRAMTEIADQSVLLADASKFTKRALHRVVDLGRFDAAVVDEHTPESDVSGLRSVGIDVEIAPATAGDDRST